MTKGLKEGGPITLTHRDITRCFMTIPEASRLVITAWGFMTKVDSDSEEGELAGIERARVTSLGDELIARDAKRRGLDPVTTETTTTYGAKATVGVLSGDVQRTVKKTAAE